MTKQAVAAFPLDTAAIIHLVRRRKNYSNSFRIVVTLKEPVCGITLQSALGAIVPRFPTVFASIKRRFFHYTVVPAEAPPCVREEEECLAPMTREEIKNCAVRVLYRENRIILEIFHSLTDGHGGMVVANTLIAEYLERRYGLTIPTTEMLLDVSEPASGAEETDDYDTYAGKKKLSLSRKRTYQLPGKTRDRVVITSRFYSAKAVLEAAHRYQVSVTAFLCAIMTSAILTIQDRHFTKAQRKRAVRIMIPVNLRRVFPSRSLRNFSLFALCGAKPEEQEISFDVLSRRIDAQLSEQTTPEYLASMMALHRNAEQFFLYRILPLFLKRLIVRLALRLFGEKNSTISLSNLGIVSLPPEMSERIEGVEIALTPRTRSPYNCGVATYGDVLSICFSRQCREPELESAFFRILNEKLAE